MKNSGMFAQALQHAFWMQSVRAHENPKQVARSRAVFVDLWKSAGWVALMAALGWCALFTAGKAHPSFPLDVGKLCSVIGIWLAGWGTWLAIQERMGSWDGSLPDEIARDGLFRLLFIPGIFFSVVGAGWWG